MFHLTSCKVIFFQYKKFVYLIKKKTTSQHRSEVKAWAPFSKFDTSNVKFFVRRKTWWTSKRATIDVLFQIVKTWCLPCQNTDVCQNCQSFRVQHVIFKPDSAFESGSFVGNDKPSFTKEAVWIPSSNGLQFPPKFEDNLL